MGTGLPKSYNHSLNPNGLTKTVTSSQREQLRKNSLTHKKGTWPPQDFSPGTYLQYVTQFTNSCNMKIQLIFMFMRHI